MPLKMLAIRICKISKWLSFLVFCEEKKVDSKLHNYSSAAPNKRALQIQLKIDSVINQIYNSSLIVFQLSILNSNLTHSKDINCSIIICFRNEEWCESRPCILLKEYNFMWLLLLLLLAHSSSDVLHGLVMCSKWLFVDSSRCADNAVLYTHIVAGDQQQLASSLMLPTVTIILYGVVTHT